MKNIFFLICLLLCSTAISLLMSGCSDDPGRVAEQDGKAGRELVLMRVDGAPLFLDELKQYLASRRPAPGNDLAAKVRERLDEFVAGEALYQEALEEHLDRKPIVRQKIRQILAQTLLEEKVYKPVTARKISEDELQKYYETHFADYSRPDVVRLATIYLAVKPGASEEEWLARQNKAEELLNQARDKSDNRFIFSDMVKKYSDKPANFSRGDTGYFDKEGRPSSLDPALVQAGFALEKVGSIGPEPVRTADGFHIVMLAARKQGMTRKFAEVKSEIEYRIRRQERQDKTREFILDARKKRKVDIDEGVFAELVSELRDKGFGEGKGAHYPPSLPGN